MKKYKMVDALPTGSAAMGAIAGASMGAHDGASPANALMAAGVGAVVGAVGGGMLLRKDRKAEKHGALNSTQFKDC
jgi:uncharacterized membrane protein